MLTRDQITEAYEKAIADDDHPAAAVLPALAGGEAA